jgi:hypothetical protein
MKTHEELNNVYRIVSKELDILKARLDPRDRDEVAKIEAVTEILVLLENYRELYMPSKEALPPVNLRPHETPEIEWKEYDVDRWTFVDQEDSDIDEIESTIRSFQAWRLHVMSEGTPQIPELDEGEDA